MSRRALAVFAFADQAENRIVAVIAYDAREAARAIVMDRAANGTLMDPSALEFLCESEIVRGAIVVDSEVGS